MYPIILQVLGDVKNLSVQLFLLRLRHEEKINKMGFPMSSKTILALPYTNGYTIPKKKLAAMINAKKNFSSTFVHESSMERELRKTSTEFSESKFMVDELNFCELFYLLFPKSYTSLIIYFLPVVSPADGNPTSPGMATHLDPEMWKTVLSITYFVIVTIITSFTMVMVHDRVPDMKKYPPHPDIFLDNVPLIPWVRTFFTNNFICISLYCNLFYF